MENLSFQVKQNQVQIIVAVFTSYEILNQLPEPLFLQIQNQNINALQGSPESKMTKS